MSTRANNRIKISVTVAPHLLRAVDAFLEAHPELDRSKVVDQALTLWCAEQQDKAIEAQFLGPLSTSEQEEHEAWRQIRRAAAERMLRRPS